MTAPPTPRQRTLLQLLAALLYAGLLAWAGWQLSKPEGPAVVLLEQLQFGDLSTDADLAIAAGGYVVRLSDGTLLRQTAKDGLTKFSLNGDYLGIYSPYAAVVQVFGTRDSRPPRTIQLQTRYADTIAVSNSGRWLAVSITQNQPDALVIYDTQTGRARPLPQSDNHTLGALLFTTGDHYLIVEGRPYNHIIDTSTWEVVARSEGGEYAYSTGLQLLALEIENSSRFEFNLMHLPDIGAPSIVHVRDPYSPSTEFRLSANGNYLIAVRDSIKPVAALVGMLPPGDDAFIPTAMSLIRVADGAVVQRFEGPRGVISSPTFTPDGSAIVTIGPGPGLTYWRINPREPWEQELRMLPTRLAPLPILLALGAWGVRRWRIGSGG